MRRDVFQAIADPTRRAILCLLAVSVMTPNALAEHFKTSRQAVSKHLQILVECELLEPQQEGREIRYHLNAGRMQEVEQFLGQFKALLNRRFAQLDEILKQMKTTKPRKH